MQRRQRAWTSSSGDANSGRLGFIAMATVCRFSYVNNKLSPMCAVDKLPVNGHGSRLMHGSLSA